MILFKMDLNAPRNTTVADFMNDVEDKLVPLRNPFMGLSGTVYYATNLHLGELQKLTDIPLQEITFEELLKS